MAEPDIEGESKTDGCTVTLIFSSLSKASAGRAAKLLHWPCRDLTAESSLLNLLNGPGTIITARNPC